MDRANGNNTQFAPHTLERESIILVHSTLEHMLSHYLYAQTFRLTQKFENSNHLSAIAKVVRQLQCFYKNASSSAARV